MTTQLDSEVLRTVLPDAIAGQRLDQALATAFPEYSRQRLQVWIRAGRVTVDSLLIDDVKRKVWGGEKIDLAVDLVGSPLVDVPENIPLAIIHEDESLIVLDKPAGLVVHPANGNWNGTMLNALLHHAPALQSVPRAGIVHRLDKDTSGLLVVAKTLVAQTDLVRQLQARTVTRAYAALVHGDVVGAGEVDAPIGRDPHVRTRMAIVAGGKPARTVYRATRRFDGYTLLECHLDTGRTHQIRVHLRSIGHPLVGDPVYIGRNIAKRGIDFPRQALHAIRLGLVHPNSGLSMTWSSPMPADLRKLLRALPAARAV